MKKILVIFLVVSVIICCYTDTLAFASQSVYPETTKMNYSFAKEEGWKTKSKQDKIESCQIPVYLAEKMSTKILLDSILSNPLMLDLLAYDTYEKGYNVIKNEISVFQMLLERDDVYNVMAEKYSECCKGRTDDDIINAIFLSVIMAQLDLIKNASDKLISTFYDSLEAKDRHIYVSCIEENAAKNDDLKILSTSSSVESGYTIVYIYIPRGIQIRASRYDGEDYTEEQQIVLHNRYTMYNQVISYLAPASKRYNCHSYAFYSQLSSNPYCIEHPYCDAFIDEGIYCQVGTPKAGDKVHWCEGDHSAIVIGVGTQAGNVVVASKCGIYGVYTQYINYVEYSGPYYFYR